VVAFILTPLLLPIAAVVANWIQDFAGLDLNGADLTAYVVSVVVGVALAVYRWLANRGEWEKVMEYVTRTHDEGAEVLGGSVVEGRKAGGRKN
jgi:hypothetical protein